MLAEVPRARFNTCTEYAAVMPRGLLKLRGRDPVSAAQVWKRRCAQVGSGSKVRLFLMFELLLISTRCEDQFEVKMVGL